jgi:transposase
VCCDFIAPALIPRRTGDRIKTDRRDARHLAILFRAGALTAIHIPSELEEAIATCCAVGRTFERICSAAGIDSPNFSYAMIVGTRRPKGAWSRRHAAWLRDLRWLLAALEQTCTAYVQAVEEAATRLVVVEEGRREPGPCSVLQRPRQGPDCRPLG